MFVSLQDMDDVVATRAQIDQFNYWNKLARYYADQNLGPQARAALTQAEGIYVAMGSPPAYYGDLEFTRGIVYGEPGAVAAHQAAQENFSQAGSYNQAELDEMSFSTSVKEQGLLATLLTPIFGVSGGRGTIGKATSYAAAVLGVEPESGYDQKKKEEVEAWCAKYLPEWFCKLSNAKKAAVVIGGLFVGSMVKDVIVRKITR